MLPAEASEHLGEAQGGDGLLPLSLCGTAWTCSGCQKRWDLMLAMQARAQEAKILRLHDHEGYFS